MTDLEVSGITLQDSNTKFTNGASFATYRYAGSSASTETQNIPIAIQGINVKTSAELIDKSIIFKMMTGTTAKTITVSNVNVMS